MEKIEYSPSRSRLIFGAVAAVAMLLVFTGFIVLTFLPSPSPQSTTEGSHLGMIAFCGAVDLFMGYALWVTIRKLRSSQTQLSLDDEGVLDHTLPFGKIPWQAILAVRTVRLRKNGVVYAVMMPLEVIDEQERLAQLTAVQRKLVTANQALGYGVINLNLTGLSVTPEELLAAINVRRQHLGLTALHLGSEPAILPLS